MIGRTSEINEGAVVVNLGEKSAILCWRLTRIEDSVVVHVTSTDFRLRYHYDHRRRIDAENVWNFVFNS